jgi:hypothetical protein
MGRYDRNLRGGVISYGCQFAGRSDMGGIMPPSKGVKQRYSPAWYIIPTMHATGEGTFNKVASHIAGYTVFFVPGTVLSFYAPLSRSCCIVCRCQSLFIGSLYPIAHA